MSMIWAMWMGAAAFGIAIMPFWMSQRTITWAGDLP
jgi:hypothetical protein